MEPEATITTKFKKLWKNYISQRLLAVVVLLIFTLTIGEDKMVIISAMGATAFIIFAIPNTVSAKAKNVVGGHLVGLASGTIFCFIALPYFIECPLAVGIAIFLMVALKDLLKKSDVSCFSIIYPFKICNCKLRL